MRQASILLMSRVCDPACAHVLCILMLDVYSARSNHAYILHVRCQCFGFLAKVAMQACLSLDGRASGVLRLPRSFWLLTPSARPERAALEETEELQRGVLRHRSRHRSKAARRSNPRGSAWMGTAPSLQCTTAFARDF